MPTLMVMLPPSTAHSRAVCAIEAWKRRLVALGSAPGVLTARVDAPERTSTPGQSTSGFGPPATFGSPAGCDDPDENQPFTRWVKDDPPEESAGGGEDDVPNAPSSEEDPAAARATARRGARG